MATDKIAPLADGFGSRGRSPAVVLGIPFFALVAVFFAVKVVQAIAAREMVTTVACAGGTAVALSFAAAFLAVGDIRTNELPAGTGIETTQTGSALTLRMGRPFGISILVLALFKTLLLLTCAVSLVVRDYDSEAAAVLGRASAVTLLLVAIGAGWLVRVSAASLRTRSRLRIGPASVELDNGSVHQVIAWDDIRDVEPGANTNHPALFIHPARSNGLATLRSSFVVDRLNRQYLRHMIINAHLFRVDPALLCHLLRFYWRHPENRGELASESALTRIRNGEFPDVPNACS
ncbi:hypothetical protein ACWDSJ_26240 [Nocardia sp. NPDC003482]